MNLKERLLDLLHKKKLIILATPDLVWDAEEQCYELLVKINLAGYVIGAHVDPVSYEIHFFDLDNVASEELLYHCGGCAELFAYIIKAVTECLSTDKKYKVHYDTLTNMVMNVTVGTTHVGVYNPQEKHLNIRRVI